MSGNGVNGAWQTVELRCADGEVHAEVYALEVEILGATLVLHRNPEPGKVAYWRVSEPRTGLKIADGGTKSAAIDAAEAKVIYEQTKRRKRSAKEAIEDAVREKLNERVLGARKGKRSNVKTKHVSR